jgi:hypothetical protein
MALTEDPATVLEQFVQEGTVPAPGPLVEVEI